MATRGAKKQYRFRLAKQQLCTCSTLFCAFLCRRCTTTTWIFLISRLWKTYVNTRQRFSFSFCGLRNSPLDFNSWKQSPTIDKLKELEWGRWTSLNQREFTFWVTSCHCCRRCSSSLMMRQECLCILFIFILKLKKKETRHWYLQVVNYLLYHPNTRHIQKLFKFTAQISFYRILDFLDENGLRLPFRSWLQFN